MERAIADRTVDDTPEAYIRDGLVYRLATKADDADLRAYLRASSMPGWVELGYEREPDYFQASAIEGDRCDVVVARELKTDKLAGFYSRSVHDVYFNGAIARLGYLGQLRVSPAYRGQVRRLRHGFEFYNTLHRQEELPFDLTAIVADNSAAQRLLTRGLPGLPRYHPLTSLTTLVMAPKNRHRKRQSSVTVRSATADDLPDIVAHLNRYNRQLQFAPMVNKDQLQSSIHSRDLEIKDFLLAFRDDELIGCVALWDQTAFKQVVLRGYRHIPPLIRPALNLGLALAAYPTLPATGRILQQATLSYWAVQPNDIETATALVDAARSLARQRKLETILLGLSDDHPLLPVLRRRFHHFAYASRLYRVQWNQDEPLPAMDDRLCHVELATL